MTYNHFNELKRSFERCAAPAMEKAGRDPWYTQFAPKKWAGSEALGHRGRILPWTAAGGTAYGLGGLGEARLDNLATPDVDESGWDLPSMPEATIGAAGALGAFGLVSPRVLANLKVKTMGKARADGGWGTKTPQEAVDEGLTGGMSVKQMGANMWQNEYLKNLGMKGLLVGGATAAEKSPEIVKGVEEFIANASGAAQNIEEQTSTSTSWNFSVPAKADGSYDGWKGTMSGPEYMAVMAEARRQVGTKGTPTVKDLQDSSDVSVANQDKKFVNSTEGKALVLRVKNSLEGKPSGLVIRKQPTGMDSMRSGFAKATEAAGDMQAVAGTMEEASKPAMEAFRQVGGDIADVAGEAGGWRKDLKGGLAQAAPAGAGALGGYIASQLLGPGVKEDETPSEREKRERLQRIYNLLGVTGGGGLGYYLANRLGGKAKTASDTQSLDIIANLGRVAARDGLH